MQADRQELGLKVQPSDIIEQLRSCSGLSLHALQNSSGVYALRDHTGGIQYIGIAHSEGFRKRIWSKHTAGSEDRSHKFSAAYNTGRLWRDRHNGCKEDGAISKWLRNRFIRKHCTASVVEIQSYVGKSALELIERGVIALSLPSEIAWNGKFNPIPEPVELIDQLIEELQLSPHQRAALDRQNLRFLETKR